MSVLSVHLLDSVATVIHGDLKPLSLPVLVVVAEDYVEDGVLAVEVPHRGSSKVISHESWNSASRQNVCT